MILSDEAFSTLFKETMFLFYPPPIDKKDDPRYAFTTDPNFMVWQKCFDGREDMAIALMEKIPVFDPNFHLENPLGHGSSCLHLAVHANMKTLTRKLLDHPLINVNKKNFFGKTPLMVGSADGWNECCQMLLNDLRVDVNAEDVTFISTIAYLVWKGHLPAVRALIDDKHKRLVVRERDLNENIYTNAEKPTKSRRMKKILECLKPVKKYYEENKK